MGVRLNTSVTMAMFCRAVEMRNVHAVDGAPHCRNASILMSVSPTMEAVNRPKHVLIRTEVLNAEVWTRLRRPPPPHPTTQSKTTYSSSEASRSPSSFRATFTENENAKHCHIQ